MSMDRLIEKLKEISESEGLAMKCGGTYSSDRLRKTLKLIEEVGCYREHPKYEKVVNALNDVKSIWQSALAKHNANQSKFMAYDIETGIPINSDK